MKADNLNFEHPLWRKLWEFRKKKIAEDELPEVNRQIEAITRRLERWKDERYERRRGVSNFQRRIADDEAERDELRTKQQLWQNYTFERAKKDFLDVNSSCFVGLTNFLPSSLGDANSSRKALKLSHATNSFHVQGEIGGLVLHAGYLLKKFIAETIYIGPLREYPERYYVFSGNPSETVGKSGSLLPDVLFKNKAILARLNEKLRDFGLDYELRIPTVSEEERELQDVFALRLVDTTTKVSASIVDVGFGISQILPIIVQSMLSRGRTLCIEQPEIHLHPALQAELATLLAECTQKPFENKFIIETHSEHLILRLQRLIRNGQFSSDDLAVFYVNKMKEGTSCVPLRLNEEGDFIDEWPNGFFEEGFRELFR